MAKKKWIQKAIEKKSALHQSMIESALEKGGVLGKHVKLVKTSPRFSKKKGK